MAEQKKSGKSKKILVADISPTIRRLIRGYLKDGYEIIEAETGEEVFSIVERHHACDSHCVKSAKGGGDAALVPEPNDSCKMKDLSVIVMSLELTDYNAMEITERLRRKYHRKCLPIIISTSNNNRDTVMLALEKGANDVIVKPFPREQLVLKIHKLEHEIPLQDLKLSELISKIPFFSGVPASQVAYILNTCAETADIEKGMAVCEQDEENYDIFILLEGKCDVIYNKKKVAEIVPVDTIGEMGFMANQKRSATVLATAPSKIIVIKKELFENYLNEERSISEMILKNTVFSLNERIRKNNVLINKLKIMAEEYLSY